MKFLTTLMIGLILVSCNKETTENNQTKDKSKSNLPYIDVCGYKFDAETDQNVVDSEISNLHGQWVIDPTMNYVENGKVVRVGFSFDYNNSEFKEQSFKFNSSLDTIAFEITSSGAFDSVKLSKVLNWGNNKGFRVLEFHKKNEKASYKSCRTYVYRFKPSEPKPLTVLGGKTSYVVGNGEQTNISDFLNDYANPDSTGYRYNRY